MIRKLSLNGCGSGCRKIYVDTLCSCLLACLSLHDAHRIEISGTVHNHKTHVASNGVNILSPLAHYKKYQPNDYRHADDKDP